LTLFAIANNGLVNAVGPSITTSLYVDYVAIYYSSWSIVTIERRLHGAINRLFWWARENGFSFSPVNPNVYISHASGVYILTPDSL
jgi:hypothetical protein